MLVQFDTFELGLTLANLSASDLKYKLGKDPITGKTRGKISDITTPSHRLNHRFPGFDCSGFIRYVLYNGTNGRLDLTGGTHNQKTALANKKFKHFNGSGARTIKNEYKSEAAKLDDMVRIGFRAAKFDQKADGTRERSRVGHVWLIINGKTYESTTKGGRNKGPKSFNWNIRENEVSEFFVLGRVPGFESKRL